MSHATALLLIHLNSLTSCSNWKRVLARAIQKVGHTLYIRAVAVKGSRLVDLNGAVNQLYYTSSKISPQTDTRVVLSDFRDLYAAGCDVRRVSALPTSRKLDAVLTDCSFGTFSDSFLSEMPNNREVLRPDGDVSFDDVECGNEQQGLFDNQAKPDGLYKNVVLGGTFDRLHTGHKMLLSAAILRCQECLTVGVTSGPMIETKKLWELIEPCETRMERLREFLMDVEPRLQYNIVPITDPFGPTAHEPDLQLLVVSDETLTGGFKVNQLRKERGLDSLDIHPIKLLDDFQACDGEEAKISSSSLRRRSLGTRLKPVKLISKPYIIGLTGGIASGKTTICKRLQSLGARVVSCDQLGHKAYDRDTECYRQIVGHFGDSILDAQLAVDRKKLGPIVFGNKEQLNKLNSIVWPEIRRLYLEQIESMKKEDDQGIIILDAAILLEAGWDQDCCEVWVSIVPSDEAVKRIMDRDKLSSEDATRRVSSQLSNCQRVAKGNVVFCSLWEQEVTAQQVLKAWKQVHDDLQSM